MSNKVNIRCLPSGVPGLDNLLGGGLPEFSFNLIAGTPGSGKTTLAHQIMFSLANPQYRALFFTVLGEPALKMLRYQQQFTFLPGWLKGLAASANYTRLVTHGDYGGTTYLTSRELPSFIPYTANASLSWRYRKFSTRVLYNFTGEHITSYNATSPALNLYRQSNKTVNFGMAYQVRPALNLSLDVANLFNEPQVLYRGFKDRTQRTLYNFVTITAGVNGRF